MGKLDQVVALFEQMLSSIKDLDEQTGTVDEFGEKLEKTGERVYKSASKMVSGTEKLSKFMTQEAKDINNVVGALNDYSEAMNSSIVMKMGQSIPVLGGGIKAFQMMQTAVAKFGSAYSQIITDMDSFSKPLRDFQKQAFGIGKAFGMSFDESDKFASGIVNLVTKSQDFKDTFISYPELLKNAEGFTRLGLSIGKMNEVVDLGQRDMNLLASATLLAGATGEDMQSVMGTLTRSIMEQGISSQQAVEQYGMFKDSAEKTGLSITTVREALEQSVGAYSQMGMAAEFAKPALDAFAMSLNSSGLGIKNAKNLAMDLTKSFANMATSYDKAFLTMSKGGMDFSGGVFGASIEMQARMMDAEKSGDQSAMAREMISAMKGTLQSFTGDDIVTVQEARESPELQKTFVMQQSLLKEMYNMNDSSATRTLEMLQELDTASLSGDVDAAGKLEEMIEEEVKGRNETLEIQERIAKNTQNNVMATILLNDNFRGMARSSRMFASSLGRGGEAVLEGGGDLAVGAFDAMGDKMEKIAASINPNYKNEGMDAFDVVAGSMVDSTESTIKGFVGTAENFGSTVMSSAQNFYNQIAQAAGLITGNMNNQGVTNQTSTSGTSTTPNYNRQTGPNNSVQGQSSSIT